MDIKQGDYYKDESGELWKVTWFTDKPTVGLERITNARPSHPIRKAIPVDSEEYREFVRLEES